MAQSNYNASKPSAYQTHWSQYSNFRLQLWASKFFGSGSRPIWFQKQNKTLHYLCNSLAPWTISEESETKFQTLLHHLKSFGSGSSHAKLFRVWLHSLAANTRLIHIIASCWTIYCSFEIILEMETVHWIGLQIQCYIQIQNHSVRYELCF